jgi:hypothetical protein
VCRKPFSNSVVSIIIEIPASSTSGGACWFFLILTQLVIVLLLYCTDNKGEKNGANNICLFASEDLLMIK